MTVTLRRLQDDGSFASNHYGEYGLNYRNVWDWIQRMVAEEFGCRADDVALIETEWDRPKHELFTADCKPVAYAMVEV